MHTHTYNKSVTILSMWSMWNCEQKDPSRTWCETKWLAWWSTNINWKRKKRMPKATTFWKERESEENPNRNLILLRQDHLNHFQFKWISMHVQSNDECKILWSFMWSAMHAQFILFPLSIVFSALVVVVFIQWNVFMFHFLMNQSELIWFQWMHTLCTSVKFDWSSTLCLFIIFIFFNFTSFFSFLHP